ncbi:MAG: short-chain dehydrogenase [Bacteroidota bacterium]
MEIEHKTVLVLGGWGLVGSAVCRRIMGEKPGRLVVTSLLRREAEEIVQTLRQEYPGLGKDFFIPWWGNIFVRHEMKNLSREEILHDPRLRACLLEDTLGELTDAVLKRSTIYRLLSKFKPTILIDCINSATAIAYQDVFQSAREVLSKLKISHPQKELTESMERLLCTLYTPQLIRHVQVLYRSMSAADTKIYLKIGTSGTGGMGLNIPYTHSEEKPSSVLLSKSAVAGAHTLLLFLMARTPDAPITKEIKPTAAIAWKKIGYGEIRKRGKPIQLYDCPPEKGFALKGTLKLRPTGKGRNGFSVPLGESLNSVYIDTGENGIFSRGEFEAISTPGQMEYVTPEEIAEDVVFEIKGGSTGHDIINALDNATLEPTYRAGFLFESAIKTLDQLEKKHNLSSIAFEILGPPRLSKLLYEAHLLRLACGEMKIVINTKSQVLSDKLTRILEQDRQLRAQIISIGVPILLPDAKTLLRGEEIKIPPYQGVNELKITPALIEHWAHDGWVDLRKENMDLWRSRFRRIVLDTERIPKDETSSRHLRTATYWKNFRDIEPGKIVGWIFTEEEKGKRMKA